MEAGSFSLSLFRLLLTTCPKQKFAQDYRLIVPVGSELPLDGEVFGQIAVTSNFHSTLPKSFPSTGFFFFFGLNGKANEQEKTKQGSTLSSLSSSHYASTSSSETSIMAVSSTVSSIK